MTALCPLNRDDLLDAQARAAPQYGTSNSSDKGSWPTERDRLLQNFVNHCRIWYEWNAAHCVTARRVVYSALKHRHGNAAVLRWQSAIKAVLDRAEAEVRDGQKTN